MSIVRGGRGGGGCGGGGLGVGAEVGYRTEALVRGRKEKMEGQVGVKGEGKPKKSGGKKSGEMKSGEKKVEKEKKAGKPAPKPNSPQKFAGQMGPAIILTSPGLYQAQSQTNAAHLHSGHTGYQFQTLPQGNLCELDRLEAQARSNPRFVSSNINTRLGNYAGQTSNIIHSTSHGTSHNHGGEIKRLEYQARTNPRVTGSSIVNRGKFSLG